MDITQKNNKLEINKQKKAAFFLLIIFFSMLYLVNQDTTTIKSYKDMQGNIICNETYVNGELTTPPCKENINIKINWSQT